MYNNSIIRRYKCHTCDTNFKKVWFKETYEWKNPCTKIAYQLKCLLGSEMYSTKGSLKRHLVQVCN
jgi:hypothetical protein